MKISNYIFTTLGVLLALFFFVRCEDEGFARKLPKYDLDKVSLPIVKTVDIDTTTITESTVEVKGIVESDGGAIVTKSGICWGTSNEPTIEQNDFSTNGPTIGEFTTQIAGLNYNTKYYARAYASNIKGTEYGNQVVFTTAVPLSKIRTLAAQNITMNSVTVGGEITEFEETVTTRGVCWSSDHDPTINDDTKKVAEANDNPFIITITGLNPSTIYKIRAFAVNKSGVSYGEIIQVRTLLEEVTDIDGNVYHAIVIGGQTWMLENLKVTRFRNGDNIADLVNHTAGYVDVYGRLYSGHAATDPRNIAPEGWRVPTLADWQTLIETLENNSGNAKEAGTAHWLAPNAGATNSSGFTALPGGLNQGGKPEGQVGSTGFWWTQTPASATELWRIAMTSSDTYFYQIPNDKSLKFSIRLIKE